MRTLVIETATPMLSVALFDGAALIGHHHALIGRGHAEALLPAIAALPNGGRAARILVSCGPGSFTGLRVGIAAARALSFAWDAQLAGYPTLALIALSATERVGAVAIPGGHGEWFVAEPGLPAISLPPAEASARVTSFNVVGDAAAALVAARGFGAAHPATADARLALALPADALLTDVTPLYGRAPDAKMAAHAA